MNSRRLIAAPEAQDVDVTFKDALLLGQKPCPEGLDVYMRVARIFHGDTRIRSRPVSRAVSRS